MAWESIDEEIIAYLGGDMSAAEREAFEAKVAADEEIAAALAAQRAFEARLSGYYRREQQEADLKKLYKELQQEQRDAFTPQKYLLAGAAVLTILVALIFLLKPDNSYCIQEQITELASLTKAPITASSQAPQAELDLKQAHILFNQAQYEQALVAYTQLQQRNILPTELQGELQFYLGQSLFFQQKPDYSTAISTFARIDSESIYKPMARWHIALSYMAQNQLSQAKSILQEIAQASYHDKRQEAKELLQKWPQLTYCE